jgi:hypothetical protein
VAESDPLRYFFLREVPFGQDGNYSHDRDAGEGFAGRDSNPRLPRALRKLDQKVALRGARAIISPAGV